MFKKSSNLPSFLPIAIGTSNLPLTSKFIIVFLLALGLFSTKSFSQGHQIKVTVHGVPKDSMCRLANYYGDKQYLQDSALADANSTVIFHGEQPLPGGI